MAEEVGQIICRFCSPLFADTGNLPRKCDRVPISDRDDAIKLCQRCGMERQSVRMKMSDAAVENCIAISNAWIGRNVLEMLKTDH